MIKIVKGDLLTVEHGIIGHQVNCQGFMGSGVAKQIKDKYLSAYKEYALTVAYAKSNSTLDSLLGTVNGVKIKDDLYVANLFGQLNYGYDGKQYTDTEALYKCFKILRTSSEKLNLPVYLPYMIGCFRGGADWKEVEELLLRAFDGHEVTLYKL